MDTTNAATATKTLCTGNEMPVLGLGTWQLPGDHAAADVEHAIQIGYRLVDTAVDYYTQPQIGEALRSISVEREQIFLVSKVEENEDSYAGTRERLDELGVDQLDLCLVHRPPPSGAGEGLWEGLIQAKRDGLTRDIGVSNYSSEQIDRLLEVADETPVVNQVEWSPFGHSNELMEHANRHGIVIQAYSPVTRGERLADERVAEIADRYGKSAAQVLLRWSIQSGAAPIPKAASPEHREENLDVFDFELDEREMRELGSLNEHYSSLGELPYV